MTTIPVTTRPPEDDIESELFSSTREAGVTCFPDPEDGFEEDD
ncbi:MAG TPA: hypothetical protein VN796_05400 [Acidimicrobiales bacterium]|nr:hypothetical protein [Acidimicrobiales bacterium]